ncbi:TPA: transketolase family protein [Candidatus Poribacteria bacterium]|nr:transketolase family protein [Candidatus Poribacteria bacterium]
MSIGKANLEIFADVLMELAQFDKDIIVVTGDSRKSARLERFAEKYPKQIVEVGIAEQNLVGISAGLASAGKKVFAVSPACFLTSRALEQIKNDVAYSDYPVKLIGISAGVSYGPLGSTHHSLHDIAALQAINNVDIVVPADNFETREIIKACINYPRPIYVRLGRNPVEDIHALGTKFEIGKAISLMRGKDVTFVASGETVSIAVRASQILMSQGISCGVISVHTIKPFDEITILNAARETQVLITVEEHSIYGGLGSLCASFLLQRGVKPSFKIVGIPDEYIVTGTQEEIFRHYGITAQGLAKTAVELLRKED